MSKNLKKDINEQIAKGSVFGLDTNILMHRPESVVQLLKQGSIVLSRDVLKELDGLKNNSNQVVAANARRAFKLIEEAQINEQHIKILPSADSAVLAQHQLSGSMDDRILASYLLYNTHGTPVCFVSNDRGAKITARNAGLDVLDISDGNRATSGFSLQKFLKRGGLFKIILIGAIVFSLFSFVQNRFFRDSFQERKQANYDNWSKNKTLAASEWLLQKISIDPKHIYYTANADDFIEPTKKGQEIFKAIATLPVSERKSPTAELRAILKPLLQQYLPSINVDKLSDKNIQSVFYYGSKDLRFGLLVLNRFDSGLTNALREVIAVDSSEQGAHFFESYENEDQIVIQLIDTMAYGPFGR
ncbi:PIN domain-containing protein [Cohnella abietis]|uniref:PIN domain-containing protein n=1 Tax=Cohnella abietis TaxID=2507935 RepID=A0A3T1DBU9_9BACL|nr:PIN domain-containing protein [Cohnella abietis]BBI35606.1 hypothetical protein KCTCHS21_50050 [Cohnella abietis]